jgi:signal transduction histidine kinase
MHAVVTTFLRGIGFVRENTQLVYTLFLLVAIPIAFFYTSQQFASIARENQDRLELQRGALLSDVFVAHAKDSLDKPEQLAALMRRVAEQNATIARFDLVVASGTSLYMLASKDADLEGKEFLFLPEMAHTKELFEFAKGKPDNPLSMSYVSKNIRHIRTVRAIPDTDNLGIKGFMVVDFSMAESDRAVRENILVAYVTLVAIVIGIMILLARQAKIIDYAMLYQKLKEVDVMKDDFVSMAAHELRSPLTVIRGYADLIKDEIPQTETTTKHLALIDRSAQQLNSLIGDILDVAKLQEGRMSFNYLAVDPPEAIAPVVESFMKPAKDKGLTLIYERSPLPMIVVDPDRFRQVLINLIGNAVKYTPAGEVRVVASEASGRVFIRVSDTGMGISAEEQKRLFEKFYRVKNSETQGITGTGLGLWITASIVKTMKGTISVESIKGKGTDFIVGFPVSQGPATER